MTMTTTVRINHPVPPEKVLDFLTVLVGGDPETALRDERNRDWQPGTTTLSNRIGQGFGALCDVTWGEGPLATSDPDFPEEEDDPPGLVECSFDSPYGYRDEQGRGCGEWHTHLLVALRDWLATEYNVDPAQCWWSAGEYRDADDGSNVGRFNGTLVNVGERDGGRDTNREQRFLETSIRMLLNEKGL